MGRSCFVIEQLHRIAARPWFYDRIQTLAGQNHLLKRISHQVAALHPETVVDAGGGTGTTQKLWPAGCRYVCLDIEMSKLRGFQSKVPGGLAVLSDATRMCIATGCADMVISKSVMHHLTDTMLEQVIEESLRVLRQGGHFILLDAILSRKRRVGRLLWSLDRGSYPRTGDELRRALEGKFRIIHWETFAIYHEYAFGIGLRP